MECCWTVNVILTDAERRSIWLSLLFNNTPCLPKHKSTIVLLWNKCMLCISCHFIPLKPSTLRMDSAKLLDVLTTLPVSHAILPHAVLFATSRTANHAICSFIDSSGYASGPIRRCLFIDYIITRLRWEKRKKRPTPICSMPYFTQYQVVFCQQVTELETLILTVVHKKVLWGSILKNYLMASCFM